MKTKIYIITTLKLTITLIVLSLAFAKCGKENPYQQYNLPPVNFTININNPAYLNLKIVGGWIYVSGGSKGLILFRRDQETINAFDRLNPDNVNSCQLKVDSSNLFAADTCAQMKYNLIDGSPGSNNANRPLIQYKTAFNGSILTVSNY